MENKKPQDVPESLEAAQQTTQEKPNPPSAQKAVPQTKTEPQEPKPTAAVKTAQSAPKVPEKKVQPAPKVPEKKVQLASAKVATHHKKAEQIKQVKPSPAKAVQPNKTAPKKFGQSVPVKAVQKATPVQTKPAQTKSAPKKPSLSLSTKAAQSTQPAKAKTRPPVFVKSAKAPQSVKSQTNQSTSAKTAQPSRGEQIKKEQPTPEKITKPTQKKANAEGMAESAKKSIFIKPKSSAEQTHTDKASVAKIPQSSKAEKPAAESKPKISLKAKFASKFKKKTKEKVASKKEIKKVEPKAADKETPTAAPADKRSAIAKLATKGFVVKSWQIAAAVVVVAVLVVGGVLLGTMLGNKDAKPEDPIVDYTGSIVDKDPEDPSNITLPGYPVLMFPASSKKVTLELPNPKGNPCYFRYTLTIVETGDVLYESARIDPGKMVKDLTLNHALSAGTYTLRITIDTFSLDSGNAPMNGGVQEVKLIVK